MQSFRETYVYKLPIAILGHFILANIIRSRSQIKAASDLIHSIDPLVFKKASDTDNTVYAWSHQMALKNE